MVFLIHSTYVGRGNPSSDSLSIKLACNEMSEMTTLKYHLKVTMISNVLSMFLQV